MEPEIRAADSDMREIEALVKKGVTSSGKLAGMSICLSCCSNQANAYADYEALQPRLDALLKANAEDVELAASLERRIATLMQKHASSVRRSISPSTPLSRRTDTQLGRCAIRVVRGLGRCYNRSGRFPIADGTRQEGTKPIGFGVTPSLCRHTDWVTMIHCTSDAIPTTTVHYATQKGDSHHVINRLSHRVPCHSLSHAALHVRESHPFRGEYEWPVCLQNCVRLDRELVVDCPGPAYPDDRHQG